MKRRNDSAFDGLPRFDGPAGSPDGPCSKRVKGRFPRKTKLGLLAGWHRRVAALKTEVRALGLAARDPRVPWYAKATAAAVVAYLLSPVDLVPDIIPVLGLLDDLVLVPLGIWFALRMIPGPVLQECRDRARDAEDLSRRSSFSAAAIVIVLLWGLAGGWLGWMIWG